MTGDKMIDKTCSVCKKIKSTDDFYKDKRSRDGFQCRCKQCHNQYNKDNKLKIAKRTKQYQKNNRDNILIWKKDYRHNNKDKLKQKQDVYNKSNAKFNSWDNKLTIDESPRLSDDGISLVVKCRYCGKYHIPTNLSVMVRVQSLNNSKSENGLYCSQGCKDACPIYNQVKYPKGYKKGTSREVQPQLRQLVLERDNYTCQECGINNDTVELHCHHIYPLNESPITSVDIDECITYCKDCHKLKHTTIAGCGYYEMRCTG